MQSHSIPRDKSQFFLNKHEALKAAVQLYLDSHKIYKNALAKNEGQEINTLLIDDKYQELKVHYKNELLGSSKNPDIYTSQSDSVKAIFATSKASEEKYHQLLCRYQTNLISIHQSLPDIIAAMETLIFKLNQFESTYESGVLNGDEVTEELTVINQLYHQFKHQAMQLKSTQLPPLETVYSGFSELKNGIAPLQASLNNKKDFSGIVRILSEIISFGESSIKSTKAMHDNAAQNIAILGSIMPAIEKRMETFTTMVNSQMYQQNNSHDLQSLGNTARSFDHYTHNYGNISQAPNQEDEFEPGSNGLASPPGGAGFFSPSTSRSNSGNSSPSKYSPPSSPEQAAAQAAMNPPYLASMPNTGLSMEKNGIFSNSAACATDEEHAARVLEGILKRNNYPNVLSIKNISVFGKKEVTLALARLIINEGNTKATINNINVLDVIAKAAEAAPTPLSDSENSAKILLESILKHDYPDVLAIEKVRVFVKQEVKVALAKLIVGGGNTKATINNINVLRMVNDGAPSLEPKPTKSLFGCFSCGSAV